MDKWMVARFRLILLCCTIIVAFFLAQGALYSREIFQEWMISNRNYYFMEDDFVDALSGKKSKDKAFLYGDAEIGVDNRNGGKLWIRESTEKRDEDPNNPLLKEGMTSKNKNNIISYSCIIIIILLIVWRIYKSRRNKKQLLQDKMDEKKLPSQIDQSPIEKKKINALPHNPIRAELVKWERKLPLSKQRRSYETIQQWLTRIGCSHEIVGVYEKIRYGDIAFTPDEEHFIQEWAKKHI
ncbi:hypothetical protein ACEOWJ_001053 [Bacillus cereus]